MRPEGDLRLAVQAIERELRVVRDGISGGLEVDKGPELSVEEREIRLNAMSIVINGLLESNALGLNPAYGQAFLRGALNAIEYANDRDNEISRIVAQDKERVNVTEATNG